MPLNFSQISISTAFVIKYALVSLTTTAIMGSFILGLISKGKEKEGVKFIPIIIIMSFTLFFVVRYLIKSMLGGLFGL